MLKNKLKKIFQAIKFQTSTITYRFPLFKKKDSKNKLPNAKRLVISYCFPPYADTAGNVMAKRIRVMEEKVDVIYNKMDRVRKIDPDLNILVDDQIVNRYEIPSYSSFSNWRAINQFVKMGLNQISNNKYESIYSRVMWPASNFLAYEYKIRHPQVKWVVEFSDPILLDINGDVRKAELGDKKFIEKANQRVLNQYGFSAVQNNNLFFWCEYLPYLFADEIIFTNENQFKYMIDNFPIKELIDVVKSKAIISPQPALPNRFYHLNESSYKLNSNKLNLAYFGTFYSTRNLNELFLGLEALNESQRELIRLHIFTSNPESLMKELKASVIEQNIVVNSYVSFFVFLNLTTRFDCLIVNDAETKSNKEINPYLPSKLSDYMGSGTKVWGICEDGSILSSMPLNYKSQLGNIKDIKHVFEKIIRCQK